MLTKSARLLYETHILGSTKERLADLWVMKRAYSPGFHENNTSS